MTAEIALLNKVAVALAADSAATISAGEQREKVFNSEDKLFELSNTQPIGIMIYNSPNFLETPIQILVKNYRSLNKNFDSIDEAAKDFRIYLSEFGKSLGDEVRERSWERLTDEPMSLVSERFTQKMQEINQSSAQDRPKNAGVADYQKIFEECVDFYMNVFEKAGTAHFLDSKAVKAIEAVSKGNAQDIDKQNLDTATKARAKKTNRLVELFLKSDISSRGSVGIVIAGFAKDELFPSLRSFVIDGMVGDTLRFMEICEEDITFEGNRARVLPYAQQEMVDRFVCGIDDKSQSKVEEFSRSLIQAFSAELLSVLGVDDENDRTVLEGLVAAAEQSFEKALREEGFGGLKQEAKNEIEEMIEFMPKPELAQMAESLVELTSVKKRVTRGFDTVGGPIDVAVISKSEGFVWIKRKHYFSAEKNARYFARTAQKSLYERRDDNGSKVVPPYPGTGTAVDGGKRPRARPKPAGSRNVKGKAGDA